MDMAAMEDIMNSERTEKEQGADLIDISALIDDVWKGVTKLWWVFFLLVSLCASLMYFRSRGGYAPKYTAYATYVVTGAELYSNNDAYNQKTAEQIGNIFPYILSSDVLMEIVAEDLGVETLPGTVTSSVMEGTNLITVKAQAQTPVMAYDLLDAVIENFPNVAQYVIGETGMNIMDESGIPTAPDNPPAFKRSAAKGAILGFILAFMLSVLYALTRNTVKKEEDLKKFLNIKCLGVLPRAKFKKRGKIKNPKVLLDNEMIPSAFVEAARTVRTRLERGLQKAKTNTFLVTSAVAGEGKTTVACNVALALTKRGYTVLLVDADMRRPAVAKTLGIEPGEEGLYEILTRQTTVRKAAIQYKDTGLRVIAGGRQVANTQRVLAGRGVKEIMRSLRYSADFVIIDTPPSAVMSDAAVIAQYVKGALYVVRQDYAKVDKILEGIELLSDTGVQFVGCVLNNAEVGITGYGYGYGYGYGRYGYGYGKYGKYGSYGSYGGYGEKKEKKGKNHKQTEE